jgi:hypothetical protein
MGISIDKKIEAYRGSIAGLFENNYRQLWASP